MLEHIRHGEKLSYYKLLGVIHEAIFEAAGNMMLRDMHAKLQARLSPLHFVAPDSPPRWAEAVEDHKQMMAALEQRDGAKFAQTAHRHIGHRAEMMQIALDTLEARTSPLNRSTASGRSSMKLSTHV